MLASRPALACVLVAALIGACSSTKPVGCEPTNSDASSSESPPQSFDSVVRGGHDIVTAKILSFDGTDPPFEEIPDRWTQITVRAMQVVKGELSKGDTLPVLFDPCWQLGDAEPFLTARDVGRVLLIVGNVTEGLRTDSGGRRDALMLRPGHSYIKHERPGPDVGIRLENDIWMDGDPHNRAEIEHAVESNARVRPVLAPRWSVLLQHARNPESDKGKMLGGEEEEGVPTPPSR